LTGSEPPTAAALVEQLGADDFNVRARALAELVRRGRASTQALQAAIGGMDPEVQVQALQGLSEIADPASAPVFAGFLDAPDERLRAFAAQGLSRIGDPRALEALVRTIDDYQDVLHDLVTPAVLQLIARGPAALPAVAPLLAASDPTTRARALHVVRQIVEANPRLGTWEALATKLGACDPGAPPPMRANAAVDPATGEVRFELLD
jgi:HEAT repeat protein